MTIKWGPERLHNGSTECPAEARDVPCTIRLLIGWHGGSGGVHGWVWPWEYVTAYCLPADVPAPAPAADPELDALVAELIDTSHGVRLSRKAAAAITALRAQIAEAEARGRIAGLKEAAAFCDAGHAGAYWGKAIRALIGDAT